MNVKVQIDGQTFEVEITDLHARPVVAVVEGQRFEVWPEDVQAEGSTPEHVPTHLAPVQPTPHTNGRTHTPPHNGNGIGNGKSAKGVHAPIPGVILSVAVQPGNHVEAGQELCVLEAMKMKNIIRAARVGTIEVVRVGAGQHVKYHDLIMEYAD